MLTIIIFALVLIIVGVILYQKARGAFPHVLVLFIVIFLLGSTLLMIIPFAGYEDAPTIEETTLIPIVKDEQVDYYLIPSEKYLYTFKTSEIHNEYGVTQETIKTLSGTNIKYYEEENRNTGVLKKYIYKPRRTLFVIGYGEEVVEYVILIPKGSVIK